MSNVDIFHTLAETNEIYGLGAKALGHKFEILIRDKNTTKEEFKEFIKRNIDSGYPCMALGIIGPPEACIIAGYQEEGDILLGWNFFQNNPDFGGSVKLMENGYFLCNDWWKNEETQAVMCMGEVIGPKVSLKEIVSNGIAALTGRSEGPYEKGINAYDAWMSALKRDQEFSEQTNEGLLHERLMCQDDAMCCLLDGRGNASKYFYNHAEKSEICKGKMYDVAYAFDNVFKIIKEMEAVLGGWGHSEERLSKFCSKEGRTQLCLLIEKAKLADEKALELLKEMF